MTKKTIAVKPMRACQRRRNRRRKSFGDISVPALAVEVEREPRHALHRADRQRRADDAVDVAVETIALRELGVLELPHESGMTHFAAAALAVDEHAYVVDAPVGDDEAGRDRLLLADLLEDPDAAVRVGPVALAQLRGRMAEDRLRLGLDVRREPQHLRCRAPAEHLGDERVGILEDLGPGRAEKDESRREQREAADGSSA